MVTAVNKPPLHGHFGQFLRHNAVLVIALCAAAITCVFVPPDAKYLGYIDFKTLACLWCTLAVVGALNDIDFFAILAQRIVTRFGTLRACVAALVTVTYVGSMFIANDMALITFLPLGYLVLKGTGRDEKMAYVFILQNIAANLGGMLTPFGNPQNLYLYGKFNIGNLEFMRIMAPPFLIAAALISISCLIVRNEPVKLLAPDTRKLDQKRAGIYAALFLGTLLIVFRVIPYSIGLPVVLITLLFMDHNALAQVDYGLLATFFCFFIFSGNLSRVPAVRELLTQWLSLDTLLVGAASCQVISNVPSAILLSQFTGDYPALLAAVNIGGTGTLIASLASLITFRAFSGYQHENVAKYLKLFTLMNAVFLVVLLVCEKLIL